TGLSESDLKKLVESFQRLQSENASKFNAILTERQRHVDHRGELQLALIPLKKKIAMFEKLRADDQKQADALSEQITGISLNQLDETKSQVDEAEKRLNGLTA